LYPQLDSDMLLIADWGSSASPTGSWPRTPVRHCCGGSPAELVCRWWTGDDGSHLALLIDPKIRGTARDRLLADVRTWPTRTPLAQLVDQSWHIGWPVATRSSPDPDDAAKLICRLQK
jgi:hypothetical protein